MKADRDCASAEGGPDLKLGLHMAGSVTLGTMNPWFGFSGVGFANSNLIPQTTVVFPCLTIEDPSADFIFPDDIEIGRRSFNFRPSGLNTNGNQKNI